MFQQQQQTQAPSFVGYFVNECMAGNGPGTTPNPAVAAAAADVIAAFDAFYTGGDPSNEAKTSVLSVFAKFCEAALTANPHVGFGHDETGLVVRFRDGRAAVLVKAAPMYGSPAIQVTGNMPDVNGPARQTPSFAVTGRPVILG